MEKVFAFIDSANDWLWSYVVIVLLVFCALYFTIRSRGVQLRLLPDMLRLLTDKGGRNGGKKAIGSFQAFAVSLSSRVGTGNLAGVASAIFVGGPGAVFWMWVMAFFGAATAFVEATLAQYYKRRGKDSFYGGPAYYMKYGLKAEWMGKLFAVLLILTFGLANQLVQSNTLCDALGDALAVDKRWIALALSLITLPIIFGGVSRISKFASIVVPIMAIGYLIVAVVIIFMNIAHVPALFALIFKSAFGLDAAAGGVVGTAVMQGVKRGLFSNEAGEGSAPNAAAIAQTSHPVKQGLLQALGVFTDTLLICSCTAFIILLSGLYDCGQDGILLTKSALVSHIGDFGAVFITLAIFLFAYSTLIGNYYYAETNVRFLTSKRWAVSLIRVVTALIIISGSLLSLTQVWSLVDLTMGVMTLVNLIAIFLLYPKVSALLKDYLDNKSKGLDPEFKADKDSPDDTPAWKE